MGSMPQCRRFKLLFRPNEVTWSDPRLVVLERGPSGKLGISFQTFTLTGDPPAQTATVLLEVKTDQCRCLQGVLRQGDRLVSVQGRPVTTCSRDQVKQMLAHLQGDQVELQVASVKSSASASSSSSRLEDQRLTWSQRGGSVDEGWSSGAQAGSAELGAANVSGSFQLFAAGVAKADSPKVIKRFLSTTSGASNSSATPSGAPTHVPTRKRFAKASSRSSSSETETGSPGPLAAVSQHSLASGASTSESASLAALSHSSSGSVRGSEMGGLRIQSLPVKLEDDYGLLPEDINIEVGGACSSLPVALPPWDGGRGPGSRDGAGVIGSVCHDPVCGVKKCCWHSFVLKNPHLIIWDPITKAVTLHRPSALVDFNFKVKLHQGPPEEVFTLVTKVALGGSARNLLHPGDWIRSVNGTPLDTADKAFKSLRDVNTFRLVIQRPAQLSTKGVSHLRTMVLSEPDCVEAAAQQRRPLPWTRIAVCGAHGSAVDFVQAWLGDEISGITLDTGALAQTFRVSLNCPDEEGFPGADRQRGDGGARVPGLAGSLHAEVYVINDEEFFHHCAAWLMPHCALVVLAFHNDKLLNQPAGEINRLAELTRTARAGPTVRSGAGPDVLLVGVHASLQPPNSAEEIQAIFYVTSCGSRLLEDPTMAPSVIVPSAPESVAACRRSVWSVCWHDCSRLLVHPVAAGVMDVLQGQRATKLSRQELNSLVSQEANGGKSLTFGAVEKDLLSVGCLLDCGPDSPYLLPINAFRAVSRLVHSNFDQYTNDARQTWFKVMTTGRATRQELVDLLGWATSPLTVEDLEQLGVVFSFPCPGRCPLARGDSGLSGEPPLEFLFPYFLAKLPSEERGVGRGADSSPVLDFNVVFQGHVSWRQYYGILQALHAQPGTEVEVKGQRSCIVTNRGHRSRLQWTSGSDRETMTDSVSRLDGCRHADETKDLQRLLRRAVPTSMSFRLEEVVPSLDGASPLGTGSKVTTGDEAQETLLKHKPANLNTLKLVELDYSVIHAVVNLLSIPMTTGHDWRSVAEKAGRNMGQILMYEQIVSNQLPAMMFFREWITTGVTVRKLLDILTELERLDVLDLLYKHLRNKGFDV